MAFQSLTIVGNLGRDPEMHYTPDGTPVTSFSVATTRKWNNADGSKGEETTWYRCSAWRSLAEVAANYLQKGRQVMVVGHLVPDRATGGPKVFQRQDGTYGSSYEVGVDRLVLLGGRVESEAATDEPAAEPVETDEIPF
jgi:single-strand DNA-binding protein